MASGRQNALFIGYRRDDTQDTAGRIYDRLVRAFGEKAVFKDVDNLPIGSDFGAHILGLLPRCRVFLALIGPDWLDAKDETGHRRLDDAGAGLSRGPERLQVPNWCFRKPHTAAFRQSYSRMVAPRLRCNTA